MDKDIVDPLFWTESTGIDVEEAELKRPRGLGLFALLGIFSIMMIALLAHSLLHARSTLGCRQNGDASSLLGRPTCP